MESDCEKGRWNLTGKGFPYKIIKNTNIHIEVTKIGPKQNQKMN